MATTTRPTISQISCFSSINRKYQLQSRSVFLSIARCPKSFAVMSLSGRGREAPRFEIRANLGGAAEGSKPFVEEAKKSYPDVQGDSSEDIGTSEPVGEPGVTQQQKRTAKIHDFCFGIPYGALLVICGAFGCIFSRSFTTLLFGGVLLALSTLSLKIWRQGKSSLPFMLGQAVVAAVFLRQNVNTYSLTKRLFPTGFYVAISAAMVCFYFYVVISGGNPPPKKLKLAASES